MLEGEVGGGFFACGEFDGIVSEFQSDVFVRRVAEEEAEVGLGIVCDQRIGNAGEEGDFGFRDRDRGRRGILGRKGKRGKKGEGREKTLFHLLLNLQTKS